MGVESVKNKEEEVVEEEHQQRCSISGC